MTDSDPKTAPASAARTVDGMKRLICSAYVCARLDNRQTSSLLVYLQRASQAWDSAGCIEANRR